MWWMMMMMMLYRKVLHGVDGSRQDPVLDELDREVLRNRNRPHHFRWFGEHKKCLSVNRVVHGTRVFGSVRISARSSRKYPSFSFLIFPQRPNARDVSLRSIRHTFFFVFDFAAHFLFLKIGS